MKGFFIEGWNIGEKSMIGLQCKENKEEAERGLEKIAGVQRRNIFKKKEADSNLDRGGHGERQNWQHN